MGHRQRLLGWLLVTGVAAGCSSGPAHDPVRPATSTPTSVRTSSAASPQPAPRHGLAVGPSVSPLTLMHRSSLYISRARRGRSNQELVRINLRKRTIAAHRWLHGRLSRPAITAGHLWVARTTDGGAESLYRLDPVRLQGSRVLRLPRSPTGSVSSLAVAGTWLWVASGSTLLRVSPTTGHVTARLRLPRADATQVVSDPADQVLLVSTGHEGRAFVETRNPRTGALINRSDVFLGVAEPAIGGVFDQLVWVSEATGMLGYITRLQLPQLTRQTVPKPLREATNGIGAAIWSNVLYVTQAAGGRGRNFCGDPATGRPEARLPIPADRELLSASASRMYYLTAWHEHRPQYLRSAPVPIACRRREAN